MRWVTRLNQLSFSLKVLPLFFPSSIEGFFPFLDRGLILYPSLFSVSIFIEEEPTLFPPPPPSNRAPSFGISLFLFLSESEEYSKGYRINKEKLSLPLNRRGDFLLPLFPFINHYPPLRWRFRGRGPHTRKIQTLKSEFPPLFLAGSPLNINGMRKGLIHPPIFSTNFRMKDYTFPPAF